MLDAAKIPYAGARQGLLILKLLQLSCLLPTLPQLQSYYFMKTSCMITEVTFLVRALTPLSYFDFIIIISSLDNGLSPYQNLKTNIYFLRALWYKRRP